MLYRRSHRAMPLVAAIAWLLYTAYEYGMYLRYLCTGECNIRVDLVLLYPPLLLLSVMGAISGAAKRRSRARRR